MKPASLATGTFSRYAKTTKRAEFQTKMNRVLRHGRRCTNGSHPILSQGGEWTADQWRGMDAAALFSAAVIQLVRPKRRGMRHHALTQQERLTNRRKSSMRAKVEHPFSIINQVSGFSKAPFAR